MGMHSSSDSTAINEINITPFVDIVLVLLIVFMISTPALVARGMKVDLANAKHSEDMSHVTLQLQIEKDGNVTLDGKPTSKDQLKTVVEGIRAKKAVVDAVIAADAVVPHGKVVEMIDHLKALGLEQVGLGTKGIASASTPATKGQAK